MSDVEDPLTAARRHARTWERRAKANYAEVQTLRAKLATLQRDRTATPATEAVEIVRGECRRLERENHHLRQALAITLRHARNPYRAATAPTTKETE